MKATFKDKPKPSKLVAVILEDGSIVLNTSVPLLKEKEYTTMSMGKWNSLSLTCGDLEYWAGLVNSTPVYEGDKITLQF